MDWDVTVRTAGDLLSQRAMAIDAGSLAARKSLILIIFIISHRTRSIFRAVLLTGGLLVRIQPEESPFRDPRDKNGTIRRTNATNSALRRESQWAPVTTEKSIRTQSSPRETDELNIQRILSYLEHAYWTFTPDGDRRSRAPDVERVLRAGLTSAATPSLKGAYVASLRGVALTSEAVGWLTRVWLGDEVVTGLTLAEPDFIALAQALAVREVPGWKAILEQQIGRTINPDRKARLQFVVSALSSDPAERDRFFASLADVANRRHEPWVLDGLRYLHHPLRAASAVKYIDPSLKLLQEIQQTGDIFFPMRWMDATLGGHRSPEAAAIVRDFVDRAPRSYPDRLRRIILSSADDLFRASPSASAR